MSQILNLFLTFLKIGGFSFGGGYAMLPLIKEEVVDVHNWLTNSEFIDILAVVEMSPGPVAINSATFIGYRVAGILGSIIATIGVVLPSIVIIVIIAKYLSKFRQSKYVDWVFRAIRGVVLGLVISAFISISKDAIVDIKGLFICGGLLFLIIYKRFHPILVILLAGLIGLVVY